MKQRIPRKRKKIFKKMGIKFIFNRQPFIKEFKHIDFIKSDEKKNPL